MIKHGEFVVETDRYNVLVPLGDRVEEIVRQCGVHDGVVYVISGHTTCGITVNERLECLEDDIMKCLAEQYPEDGDYYHARFLESYGAMAGNPTGHLKAMVTGNHAVFTIAEGHMRKGHAQEIYLAEFDGPQERTVYVTVIGE
ncbi:secondary thiamine-phosphate synthase enzyme YjbQ [Enorma burkinafasonensis]|uniref:secondary thiamine-phosphate synthase enzyme YjbQ n=1 Tax=Enorma burkinafasonensis TaxID=2590867 RepID=UPI0011A50E3A|nr:secondary thiamine-phosphate synthase enzyme YjbQ [Enorma burkinafasonensis]